jgi:MarR family transcriptional regulator, organic hydroperoxide resistance regulator
VQAPADGIENWPTGRLLSAAARLVEHEWNTHLSQWDLNHAGLPVLHVLFGGDHTQRELAASIGVEDQTMSRTLDRLERSGYVERHRDPADRRRVVVTLTGPGRSACREAVATHRSETIFAEVEDLPELRRSLVAVIEHLSRQRWPGYDGGSRPSRPTPEEP